MIKKIISRNGYSIYSIFIIAIIFISIIIFMPISSNNNKTSSNIIKSNLNIGDGPETTCFVSLGLNFIDSGVEFIVCHLNSIIDEYVSYTPNIFDNQSDLSSNFLKSLYSPIEKLSLIIMPLSILIIIAINIIEISINQEEEINIKESISKFIMNIIYIILLPFIYSSSIDLNNAICKKILDLISPEGNKSLSSIISENIHLGESSNGAIPQLALTILWVSLLVSILFIAVFFVVRFIIIGIIFLIIPLLIAFSLIPIFNNIKESLFSKLISLIIIQPVFLVGFGFFIIIVKGEMDSISKFILAICALLTLGFIPTIIAGFAGDRIANISILKTKKISSAIIDRFSIAINKIDEKLQQ